MAEEYVLSLSDDQMSLVEHYIAKNWDLFHSPGAVSDLPDLSEMLNKKDNLLSTQSQWNEDVEEITLVEGEEGLELFGSETGQEVGLSPATLGTAEPIAVAKTENTTANSSEEGKGSTRGASRIFQSSLPNMQGAQHCPVCGKTFGKTSSRNRHLKTHSIERPYACSMCPKTFNRGDSLRAHVLTHKSEEPFMCKVEGCGKAFRVNRSLRKHMEKLHSSSGSTPEP